MSKFLDCKINKHSSIGDLLKLLGSLLLSVVLVLFTVWVTVEAFS